MHPTARQSIVRAIFRANPAYELVTLDRLPPKHQEFLRDLTRDPDFSGILLPRVQSSSGIKSVCRDTALLFSMLREPGKLPAHITALSSDRFHEDLARLVLDGVLEIEHQGTFVSGADAYEHLYGRTYVPTAQTAVARLSIEALQYAQALDLADAAQISERMYCYNRRPLSPAWIRRLPTAEAVAEHLGIQPGGSTVPMLERGWRVVLVTASSGWLGWEPRHPRRDSGTGYKLYVSPSCELVRDVFRATVGVLATVDSPPFKIGKDVYGLLRPDKIVVYFARLAELQEAADRLWREIDGAPAHGVPFSAEIAGDGLLSWGVDPPAHTQALRWQERESWRLWVTNRLATYLLAAKASSSRTMEPWVFALERLRLEGVDTASWTPTASMWTDRSAAEC